jgi:hypothetical protein
MKQKKPSQSKPKLSFTVDRSEFDISSDWVQAVMRPPALPGRSAPFFSPDINNATGEEAAPVVETAPDENVAAVEDNSTEANHTTVIRVVENPPVVLFAPVENNATDAKNTLRAWKLRPLRRITDGLTPGQYAVYSLMFENTDTEEGGERLYRGGYADIGRLTGLSKRGIQNVIGELQEKDVIRLHRAPGHHRLQTSAYVVPHPDAVLAAWFEHGWRFSTGKSKHLTDGATVAGFATQGAA